ncbi:hypothetical protein EXIGLDRAFT_786795 [Exidia glandulosa HHB12029]|uniref:Chitinase n=1 Tax=Exidia glandulosa HHB12029 TaxID=1314781 RepID=A0A165PA84_EXIGL|nr:hypothetical protein EXIGLDRAFT_786795 [Exidia glandulosa HHB12029]
MPLFLFAVLVLLQALSVAGSVLNKKQILIGSLAYDSIHYYPLSQTPDYDVVAISYLAFSSATHLDGSTYAPLRVSHSYPQAATRESEEVLKASIKNRTSRGRFVQISIFNFSPETEADRQRLIDVVNDVVAKYGVTGVDISSLATDISLDPGDTDYANPTTAAVINLISALKILKSIHGDDFLLTITPALPTIQGGHSNYSGSSGVFIPIIEALRDEIDIVCPSNYLGRTWVRWIRTCRCPDMLLNGFSVAGSNPQPFAPLRQDQVCVSAFSTDDTGPYGYVAPTAKTLHGNLDTVALPFPSYASVSVIRSSGVTTASPTTVGQSRLPESDPISTASQSGSPSSGAIDEPPEVTSTTTSKKVQIVAAVVPVVVIIFGIAFIPIRKCRKRRRGPSRSHSPRSSYDSEKSSVQSPHDKTVQPYIMMMTAGGSGWPLDTKGAAFLQATKSSGALQANDSDSEEVSMQALRAAAERAGISLPQLVGSLNSVSGQASEVADSDRPPMYDAGSNA